MTTGVALFDKIKSRSHEDVDCWIWDGAVQGCSPTPAMRHQGQVKPVRRFILEEAGPVPKGVIATYCCENELCVNPEHVTRMSRKSLQQRTAKQVDVATRLIRSRKMAAHMRAHRSKLTEEQRIEILASSETQRKIAARMGVSQQCICDLRTGNSWKNYSNPYLQLMA